MKQSTQWTEILIEIPVAEAERASAIAQMAVPYGLYLEDYSDLETEAPKIAHIDLIDEELLAKDQTKAVIHLYISPEENPSEALSFLEERLSAQEIPHSIRTSSIQEEDWAFGWKKYYHPIKVGEKLVICPSWEDYQTKEGEVLVRLDPGMAFGTGTHETTRLCMQMLERFVRPGHRILDIGCGSGILSICGVLLGASQAVGIDIDKTAVNTAKGNAVMNQVQEQTQYLCGDLTSQVQPQKCQIICANIVADIILRLIPDVRQFLTEDGVFLTSGIIDTREAEVTAALEQSGYSIVEVRREKGWCAIAAVPAAQS